MSSRTSSKTGAVTYAAPAKIAAIAATTTTATATATIVHLSIIDTIPATATNDDSALTYVSMKNVNIVRCIDITIQYNIPICRGYKNSGFMLIIQQQYIY